MHYKSAIKALILAIASPPWLLAQHPETPVFHQNAHGIGEIRKEIIEKAVALRARVPAIKKEEIDRQLLSPLPQPVQLPAPHAHPLSPEGIATHARKSNLRVGHCYKCTRCDDWHLNLAGGYAIAKDVIVTCDHVMVNQRRMSDGFFVVADLEGNVALAVAVLARSAAMDTAIVKVAGAEFTPVPLNPDVKQGAPAFCFSYPLRQEGFFSAGVVNRFFWNEKYRGEAPQSLDAMLHLRVNFSTDWAPGSSGSAIFDQAGNAIGHVSTITGLSRGNNKPALLTLRTGVPARAVQTLVKNLEHPGEIQRLAAATGPQHEGVPDPDDPEE